MNLTLSTKRLAAHLLQHLRSTHDFGLRSSITVRDGSGVSVEASADGSEVLSVFDMERGPIIIERVAKLNPFAWDRATALTGAYEKRAAVGPGQVGISSTHTYLGLAHCSMVTSQETLTLYFNLGMLETAKRLSDPEKLVLLLQANEQGQRRKDAFETLLRKSGVDARQVLAQLREKTLVRAGMKNSKTGEVTSWGITAEGREVLSQLNYTVQRELELRFLGRDY